MCAKQGVSTWHGGVPQLGAIDIILTLRLGCISTPVAPWVYVCGMGLEPSLDRVAGNISSKFELRGGARGGVGGRLPLQTLDQGQMQ